MKKMILSLKIPIKYLNIYNLTMTDLIEACRDGDINKVKFILNKKVKINPNFQGEIGNTILSIAVFGGDIEIVKLLLQYEHYSEKINPNFQDIGGCTSLAIASCLGYTKITKLLLQYGHYSEKINPNLKTNHKYTALIWASIYENTEIIKLLLDYKNYSEKIDLDAKTIICYTVFDYCKGRIKTTKLLEKYKYFRKNIQLFIPPYNILLTILINERFTNMCDKYNLPNELILLIKKYGEMICGKDI